MSSFVATPLPVFQVRPACEADAEDLIQLHFRVVQAIASSFYSPQVRAAWSPPPSPARHAWMRQTIAAPERRVLLAEAAGKCSGFTICAPEQSLVLALYVDPACAGLGLGRCLLEAVEEVLRQAGCASAALKASLNAVGFYQAMGYRPAAEALQPLADGVAMACREMEKRLG